jgi:hypothetical protein
MLRCLRTLGTDMRPEPLFTLHISPTEAYSPVRIVEVCPPRFRGDTETHRVMLPGGGILRVFPSQLRPYHA